MKRLQTSVDSYLCKTLNIHIQIPAVLRKIKIKLIIKQRRITQNRLLPRARRLNLRPDMKSYSFVSCGILWFLKGTQTKCIVVIMVVSKGTLESRMHLNVFSLQGSYFLQHSLPPTRSCCIVGLTSADLVHLCSLTIPLNQTRTITKTYNFKPCNIFLVPAITITGSSFDSRHWAVVSLWVGRDFCPPIKSDRDWMGTVEPQSTSTRHAASVDLWMPVLVSAQAGIFK